MRYEDAAKKYGEVTLDGVTVALIQDAQLAQAGAPAVTYYMATGIDRAGNEYEVIWDNLYDGHVCGDDGCCTVEGCHCECQDEGNAADWDNPSSIERI